MGNQHLISSMLSSTNHIYLEHQRLILWLIYGQLSFIRNPFRVQLFLEPKVGIHNWVKRYFWMASKSGHRGNRTFFLSKTDTTLPIDCRLIIYSRLTVIVRTYSWVYRFWCVCVSWTDLKWKIASRHFLSPLFNLPLFSNPIVPTSISLTLLFTPFHNLSLELFLHLFSSFFLPLSLSRLFIFTAFFFPLKKNWIAI